MAKKGLYELFSKDKLKRFKELGLYQLIDKHNDFKSKMEARFYKAPPPLKLWTPQVGAQVEIEKAIKDSYIKEIAIHGSRGGGKTFAVICSQSQERIAKYGKAYNGVYLKKTAKDLDEIKRDFIDLLEDKIGCSGGRSNSNTIYFKNGATLKFSYFDKDGVTALKGGNITDLIVEEADDIPNLSDYLPKALISVRSGKDIDTKVIIIYNYSGPSYPYLKKRYNELGHFKAIDKGGRGVISIKSLMEENQIMLEKNKDYALAFEDLPTNIKEAWLLANEDAAISGVAFDCLNKENNGVKWFDIRELQLPYIIGLDWGFRSKAVAVFVAIDRAGRFIIFDEIVRSGVTPADFAVLIKNKMQYYGAERCLRRIADSAIGQHFDGNSVREQFYAEGLHFENANKDRAGGYMLLYSLFKKKRLFALVGGDDYTCSTKNFWATVPTLITDEKQCDDIMQYPKQDDHEYDALRYALMGLNDIKNINKYL